MSTFFITGATGFAGSHVAEEAKKRGHTVRCLARANSDTAFLQTLGVELIPGDLSDAKSLDGVFDGVDVVVHCAAKVGDWGPVEDYRSVNVGGLKNLLDAVRGKPLQRFVHVSSLGVYEAKHHYGTDESEPLPDIHIDGYTQTKVESEKLALQAFREEQIPIAIVRPGFIYGPRDRSVLPRIIERLEAGKVIYISRGKYALNTTYIGNLVQAIFLAIDNPAAVGEVFNINDGEFVSKRRFFEAIADGLNLPRPKRSIPLFLAKMIANWREAKFRKENRPNPPKVTQAILKFAGLNLDFSIGKARTVLGYTPATSFQDGMNQTITWLANSRAQSR